MRVNRQLCFISISICKIAPNTSLTASWSRPLQYVGRPLKQIILRTSPSSTVGWEPSNQPDQSVPHLYAGGWVGIFVPAAPTKWYHPSGSREVGCHITLHRLVLSNCFSSDITQVLILITRIGCKLKLNNNDNNNKRNFHCSYHNDGNNTEMKWNIT